MSGALIVITGAGFKINKKSSAPLIRPDSDWSKIFPTFSDERAQPPGQFSRFSFKIMLTTERGVLCEKNEMK